jgi:SagB-type dehydrogenase family enzyme
LPPAVLRFDEAVLLRRSVRDFTSQPLQLGHVAKLLSFGNGVTGEVATPDGRPQHFRAAPSGGALYPVELYVASLVVEGLEPGVHHYDPVAHALELVRPGRFADPLASLTYTPELASSAAVIVLTGVTVKSRVKYGERAYRFLLIEAGHIAQNVLLTATALDLGACPIGGFVDDELDDLLGLDGLDEVSLYLIAVGHPR